VYNPKVAALAKLAKKMLATLLSVGPFSSPAQRSNRLQHPLAPALVLPVSELIKVVLRASSS